MDQFDAPEAEDDYDSPWILICQGVLAFCGFVYLLLGVLGGGAYTILPILLIDEDPGMIVMVPFGVIILLISLVVAGANFAAVWGLGARKTWGFVIALIMAALYLPSGCMPFGAILFYGLLIHEPTRKQFLN